MDDDRDLLTRVRHGDLAAMNELIRRHTAALHGYLWRLAGSDIDDLFQETWIKVWKNIKRYDMNRPFKPWLFTVASNVYKDQWRKNQVRDKYEQQAPVPDTHHSTDHKMDIKKALSTLPPEQRNALVLRYYEGYTEKETASIMKCPVGTVKTRVFQALRKLKEVFTHNGYLQTDTGNNN
jgi:RNA polymerase sigma-70 factor (ECF subfamily)